MSKVYVGTRVGTTKMNSLLGRSVAQLNERLSVTVRRAAIDNGVKATVKGAKLEFFSLEENEYATVKSNSEMLVKMTADDLSNELKRVNSSYPARMDYDTAERYKADLRSAMAGALKVIGADPVTKKTVDPNKTTSVMFSVSRALLGGDGKGLFMKITSAVMWYGPAKFNNLAEIYVTTDPNAVFSYDSKVKKDNCKGKIVVPVSEEDFNELESIMNRCYGEQGCSAALSLTLGNRNKDLVKTFVYEHDYL